MELSNDSKISLFSEIEKFANTGLTHLIYKEKRGIISKISFRQLDLSKKVVGAN